ncbi:hypothetical protein GCM10010193_67940 [Kitasatospora atroaurantiaca]|uniref:Uncharacterized protein n=1 Tax=Kitasatospora atroaurantiaca TaxID=285545 RepID=A0A561EHT3_9ACTN|nr:hypothetical protein FB465_0044 [Kitasatospora atroaurantiaca]
MNRTANGRCKRCRLALASTGLTGRLVAEGVREHIEAARTRQAAHPPQPGSGRPPSPASLRTDLEMARHEIAPLRLERDNLKNVVRRNLGQQLDQVGVGELVTRINELTVQLDEFRAAREAWKREKQDLETKLSEAVEDLEAARASLRRMVRAASTAPSTNQ